MLTMCKLRAGTKGQDPARVHYWMDLVDRELDNHALR